jgi:hypothetical protein
MNFLSRLLLRLGYVRIKDFGYTLTQDGRIVELPRPTGDRLTPVPWQPIALAGASSHQLAGSPPVPRPLPPPPAQAMAPAPAGFAGPETGPPLADTASGMIVNPPVLPHGNRPRTRSEEEQDEWRVALARARERAARDAVRSQARSARLSAEMRVPPPPLDLPDATRLGIGPARAPATEDDVHAAGRGGSDFAEGSRRHPISRGDSGDVTATDLIRAPAPEEDDTSVDATANRLAGAMQAESEPVDNTIVALAPPPGPPPPADRQPRTTARHRRA